MITDLPLKSVVKSIATYLANPESLKSFLEGNRLNKSISWDPISVSTGYPALLILFAELERLFPHEQWGAVAHEYVLAIKESIEIKPISNISLFDGLAGCCFSIQQASAGGVRYSKILATLNDYILAHLENTYLINFRNHLLKSSPVRVDLYDLLHGIVGIGLYCLRNPSSPSFQFWVGEIVACLIDFTQPVVKKGIEVPGWYLEQEDGVIELGFGEFPAKRYFNLSLSNGIVGVLAFLSIAYRGGCSIRGLKEAIYRICQWLQKVAVKTGEQLSWDKGVSFEEEISKNKTEVVYKNQGWNSGTPGVARALYLAGISLHDDDLTEYALKAFLTFSEGEQNLRDEADISIGTGFSGLYLITKLMARDTGSQFLEEQANFYYAELLKQVSSMSRDLHSHSSLGILSGLSGSLLALLYEDTSDWHKLFLIDWV